jgi:hypothetical protein
LIRKRKKNVNQQHHRSQKIKKKFFCGNIRFNELVQHSKDGDNHSNKKFLELWIVLKINEEKHDLKYEKQNKKLKK